MRTVACIGVVERGTTSRPRGPGRRSRSSSARLVGVEQAEADLVRDARRPARRLRARSAPPRRSASARASSRTAYSKPAPASRAVVDLRVGPVGTWSGCRRRRRLAARPDRLAHAAAGRRNRSSVPPWLAITASKRYSRRPGSSYASTNTGATWPAYGAPGRRMTRSGSSAQRGGGGRGERRERRRGRADHRRPPPPHVSLRTSPRSRRRTSRAIGLRLSFIVGVSSSPPGAQSPATIVNFLTCSTRASCALPASTPAWTAARIRLVGGELLERRALEPVLGRPGGREVGVEHDQRGVVGPAVADRARPARSAATRP